MPTTRGSASCRISKPAASKSARPSQTLRQTSSTIPKVQKPQPGIKLFAQVKKNVSVPASDAKKAEGPGVSSQQCQASPEMILGKRKRTEPEATTSFLGTKEPRTPQKQQRCSAYLPSPSPTPKITRSAERPADTSRLPSQTILKTSQFLNTPPASPCSERKVKALLTETNNEAAEEEPSEDNEQELPERLNDFISLNASFLKALSLHIAHYDAAAPINIADLTRSIGRIWGRREATLKDIRQCLGISRIAQPDKMENELDGIEIQDYGHGKVCLELNMSSLRKGGLRHPFDERRLRRHFENNLHRRWDEFISQEGDDDEDSFVSQLPLVDIIACPSLAKVRTLTSEGQRRLRELKFTAKSAASHGKVAKRMLETTAKLDTKGRGQGLFERLRLKGQQQASQATAPTQESLDRQAALQRLPNVVRILCFFAAANQRSSQSLSRVVERIQGSSRTALSTEEVQRCISILAENEIGGGFVSLVQSGSVTGVVIDHGRRPVNIEAVVQAALTEPKPSVV